MHIDDLACFHCSNEFPYIRLYRRENKSGQTVPADSALLATPTMTRLTRRDHRRLVTISAILDEAEKKLIFPRKVKEDE